MMERHLSLPPISGSHNFVQGQELRQFHSMRIVFFHALNLSLFWRIEKGFKLGMFNLQRVLHLNQQSFGI